MDNEYLPYGRFEWLKNVNKFDVMSISECNSIEKSPIWSFLEVDPEHSDKLHELQNNYPLAPEKLAVSGDMLSKYCKKLLINMR